MQYNSNRFCKKFNGQILAATSKEVPQNFSIDMDDYFKHSFCKTMKNYKHLDIYEKEIPTYGNYGYIEWYITDGKKIYNYNAREITYFKSGIKYGTANFVKQ